MTKNWRDRSRYDTDFPEVHDSVWPADVRPQERLVTRIRLAGSNSDFKTVRTWRISPLGIELEAEERGLAKGDRVDLELVIAGQRTTSTGIVVTTLRVDGHEILGVRFTSKEKDTQHEVDRRRSPRWLCSPKFFPIGVAPSPMFFNEWMHFQVHDISSGGMQLNTSLRNKYIFPGLNLQLTVAFPIGGSIAIQARVARVDIGSFGSEDRLIVGVTFESLDKRSKNTIGQYLAQFCETSSMQEFVDEGFFPESILPGVKFGFLKTESEYEEVLKLRFQANSVSGQIGSAVDHYDMSDQYDTTARIIVAKRNNEVISTLRVRFPTREDPLEAEKYVKWPEGLPLPSQVTEFSRLAVDPDFRGTDLMTGMLRYMGITCISTDRRIAVLSTMKKYVHFYEKAGFHETGVEYRDPTWSEPLCIMMTDTFDTAVGRNVNPFYWNLLWKDVGELLVSTGLVPATGLDYARMRYYRFLSPLSKPLIYFLRRQKK